MLVFQLTIHATIDGADVPGFPLQFARECLEAQPFSVTRAGDGNATTFTALPVSEVNSIEALCFVCDGAAGLRLEGGEAGTVALRLVAGGGCIVWGAALTGSNVTVNNNSAADIQVHGAAVGT